MWPAKKGATGRDGRQARPAPPAHTMIHLVAMRSEEHTSELQSPCNLVCRLLLEKKELKPIDAERLCHCEYKRIPLGCANHGKTNSRISACRLDVCFFFF